VNDNIRAMIDGSHKVASGAKSVVHDDGYAGLVGDFGYLFEIGDVVSRVADALNVDCLCVLVDR
jgi:hypothetical protein